MGKPSTRRPAEQASEGAQTGGLAGPVQVMEVPAARSDAEDAPEIEQKTSRAGGRKPRRAAAERCGAEC